MRWVTLKIKKKNSRAREANGSNDRPGETLKVPRAQVNIKHSVFTWRHDSHLVTKRRLCMLVSMSEINPVGVDPPINLHSCCAACQVTIRTLAWYFLRDSSSPVYNATMPSCILCVQRSEVGGKALNSISFCDGVAGRYVTVEIAPSACRCTKCVKKPWFLAA